MKKTSYSAKNGSLFPTQRLALTAVFCALAYVTACLPIFKVQFLSFELKDTVITLGAMVLGPITALSLSVAVPLLEMLTISDTGFYGLLMNILSSIAFSFVASVIYRYRRTLYGALWGLLAGSACMVTVMVAANLLITPFYTGWSVAAVADLILPLLLPFNIAKATLSAALVMLLYKPTSNALKQARLLPGTPAPRGKMNVAVLLLSLLLIALSLALLFLFLHADFA